jgi:hypothetical protein
MRFMMLVKGNKNYEAGVPPDPALMAAIGQHAQEMMKRGKLLESGGLLPSSAGARVRVAGGRVTVVDGPFTEAKELIGGYAIMQAESRAEAVEMGKQFMKLHVDVLGTSYEGELEIRQLAEFAAEDENHVTAGTTRAS